MRVNVRRKFDCAVSMDELTETLTARCDMIVGIGALAMDDWQRRISINPEVLVGKPVIAGTRIAVELIVERLGAGGPKSKFSNSTTTSPPMTFTPA
jgi:hypothetical protein